MRPSRRPSKLRFDELLGRKWHRRGSGVQFNPTRVGFLTPVPTHHEVRVFVEAATPTGLILRARAKRGRLEGWPQAEIYALVADTHEQARAALVAGAGTGDVDSGIRSAFERAGMAGRHLDGLGHGIGREVHERPIIGLSPSVPLRPGMVF